MPAGPASFWGKADLPNPGAGSLYLLVPWMVSRIHNSWFSLNFFFPCCLLAPTLTLENTFFNLSEQSNSNGSESQKNEMAVSRRRKFGPWNLAMEGSLRYEATTLAKQVGPTTYAHLPLPAKQERQMHPGNLLHVPVGFQGWN